MITIRASSLPTYPDCPRRWAAQTLQGLLVRLNFLTPRSMPKSIGASVGTAVHGGAAYMLTEKINTGLAANATESEHRALIDFETSMQENGVLWDDTTPNLSDGQRQVARMVKVYRATLAETIKPLVVERRLEARVGEGVILSGQNDTQAVEPDIIRDLKTGRQHRTHYAQLGSYSLLVRTAHPESAAKAVCTDFIKRVPVNKEQPLPLTEIYDQGVAENAAVSTIHRIKQDVDEFHRRLDAEDAPPEHAFLANPGSNLCNPKYCSAWGTAFCREHKGAHHA
jgi:hypothetical protein